MKVLIAILLLLGAFWVGKQLLRTYERVEKTTSESASNTSTGAPSTAPAAAALPGLPAELESSLSAAEKQGAVGLGTWLSRYRGQVRDPRLAAIELDYVVLLSRQNPSEAKRVFQEVRERTPTFSPVYERVKRLEKTFQ